MMVEMGLVLTTGLGSSSRPKMCEGDTRIIKEFAMLRGPVVFVDNNWLTLDSGLGTAHDVSSWPHSVNCLVRFTAFLVCTNVGLGTSFCLRRRFLRLDPPEGNWLPHFTPSGL